MVSIEVPGIADQTGRYCAVSWNADVTVMLVTLKVLEHGI